MKFFIILLSAQISLVFSQWYRGEEAIQRKTTSVEIEFDVSSPKTFSTKSRTECILRCRMQAKEILFVETLEQCFCLETWEKVLENPTAMKNDRRILYKQITDLSESTTEEDIKTMQVGNFNESLFLREKFICVTKYQNLYQSLKLYHSLTLKSKHRCLV